MPNSDSTEPAAPSSFELAPLSQLGAVTGRFVHDLANEISSAATLMTLIQEPDSGTTPAKEDLEELNAALERAVTMIHHFGATVRTLRPPPEPIFYAKLAAPIQALFAHHGIALTVDSSVTNETLVLCHPDWLLHCIDYAAISCPGTARSATVSLVPAKSVTPPVDYYSIDKPTHLFAVTVTATPEKATPPPVKTSENLPLFVTRELLRHMRGFLLNADGTFSIYLATEKTVDGE